MAAWETGFHDLVMICVHLIELAGIVVIVVSMIRALLTLLLHWEIGTEEKRQRERIQPELIHAGEEKK